MRNYKNILRASLLYVLVVITAAGYPLSAIASSVEPSPTAPLTTNSVSIPKETYTLNPDTNHWDSNKWKYNPETGSYQRPPAPAPPIITTPETPVVAGAGNQASRTTSSAPSTIAPSTTTDPVRSNGSTTITQQSSIGATNNVTSQSESGSASVTTNTTGGNATSGDASATTTIVNAVHSTVQGDTAGIAHFSADIHGNVVGDITLAPALDDALNQSTNTPTSTTTIQTDQAIDLTNNISLGAVSGDSEVSDNTTAGNATTGTANTVANVINLINSIIAANKSFVGTINIYGNLDGDILVSPDFIPQLLASNVPIVDASDSPTILGVNDTQSIVNNVTLNAATGSANVLNNTRAGDAATGTAATNLTILNYTGRQVVASNSLLIFVNVLGRWVGIIVDAPVGATAAVLGNGVTSNVANDGSQVVDANSTSSITNNIDLASLTGDAMVRGNTQAGSATSGNATASANIANISTSSFSISDWFGVLFINVFGTWYGSFGVDTANGTITPITGGVIPQEPRIPTSVNSMPQFDFKPRQAERSTPTSRSPIIVPAQTPSMAEVVSTIATVPFDTPEADRGNPVIVSRPTQPGAISMALVIASLISATVAAGVGLYRRQDS